MFPNFIKYLIAPKDGIDKIKFSVFLPTKVQTLTFLNESETFFLQS